VNVWVELSILQDASFTVGPNDKMLALLRMGAHLAKQQLDDYRW
jgi:hypothetical protein